MSVDGAVSTDGAVLVVGSVLGAALGSLDGAVVDCSLGAALGSGAEADADGDVLGASSVGSADGSVELSDDALSDGEAVESAGAGFDRLARSLLTWLIVVPSPPERAVPVNSSTPVRAKAANANAARAPPAIRFHGRGLRSLVAGLNVSSRIEAESAGKTGLLTAVGSSEIEAASAVPAVLGASRVTVCTDTFVPRCRRPATSVVLTFSRVVRSDAV